MFLSYQLNFGQSPDKHNSWNTVKAHRQAGGFTPVKLPNEFGMVPDEDGNSIGSLISPWKIVDSPSYACGVSTQVLKYDQDGLCVCVYIYIYDFLIVLQYCKI